MLSFFVLCYSRILISLDVTLISRISCLLGLLGQIVNIAIEVVTCRNDHLVLRHLDEVVDRGRVTFIRAQQISVSHVNHDEVTHR